MTYCSQENCLQVVGNGTVQNRTELFSPVQCRTERDGIEGLLTLTNYLKLGARSETEVLFS
jgi:hypothetical protein